MGFRGFAAEDFSEGTQEGVSKDRRGVLSVGMKEIDILGAPRDRVDSSRQFVNQ